MRTTLPLALTVALFISAAFFAGSGFNSIVSGDRGMQDLREEVDDSAEVDSGDDLSAQRGSDESSIVGLVVGAGQTLSSVVGLVILLPITLQKLGFPLWFAAPVGSVLEILVIVGFAQFATGRVLR